MSRATRFGRQDTGSVTWQGARAPALRECGDETERRRTTRRRRARRASPQHAHWLRGPTDTPAALPTPRPLYVSLPALPLCALQIIPAKLLPVRIIKYREPAFCVTCRISITYEFLIEHFYFLLLFK